MHNAINQNNVSLLNFKFVKLKVIDVANSMINKINFGSNKSEEVGKVKHNAK